MNTYQKKTLEARIAELEKRIEKLEAVIESLKASDVLSDENLPAIADMQDYKGFLDHNNYRDTASNRNEYLTLKSSWNYHNSVFVANEKGSAYDSDPRKVDYEKQQRCDNALEKMSWIECQLGY